jgi:hypothetical protein
MSQASLVAEVLGGMLCGKLQCDPLQCVRLRWTRGSHGVPGARHGLASWCPSENRSCPIVSVFGFSVKSSLLLVWAFGSFACSSAPEPTGPLALPRLMTSIDYSLGSLFSTNSADSPDSPDGAGGTDTTGDEAPRPAAAIEAWSVTLRGYVTEREVPLAWVEPLISVAEVVSVPQSGSAILPIARLAREAAIARDGAAETLARNLESGELGQQALVLETSGVILPGTTARFLVSSDDGARPVTLAFSRKLGGTSLDVGLTLTGAPPAAQFGAERSLATAGDKSPTGASGATTSPSAEKRSALVGLEPLDALTTTSWSETIVWSIPTVGEGRRFVVLPIAVFSLGTLSVGAIPIAAAPTIGERHSDPGRADAATVQRPTESQRVRPTPPRALLIEVAVEPASENWDEPRSLAHEKMFQESLAALARTSAPAATVIRFRPGVSVALESAMLGLRSSATRRSALVFLASSTGASFTQDLALVAGDDVLSAVTSRATTELAASPASDDVALGWVIERASFTSIAPTLEEGGLAAEIEAALTRHAGEVGRHATTLLTVARESDGLEAFHRRVIAENFLFLEDSSPASRTRAFDYLSRRGLAPAGFDPLGSRAARRSALIQATEVPSADETATGVAGTSKESEATKATFPSGSSE